MTCIRSIPEYACPVFHNGLSKYLSDELERIQKRAMQIIFSNINYQKVLKKCIVRPSYERREYLTNKTLERALTQWGYITCPLLRNCGVRVADGFLGGGVCSETSASLKLINFGLQDHLSKVLCTQVTQQGQKYHRSNQRTNLYLRMPNSLLNSSILAIYGGLV